MESVETTRSRYRPKEILTLFVGESAPSGGTFFYYDNSQLARYMKRAMEAGGLEVGNDFLGRFKAYGWYLDDLVLTPVNNLKGPQRTKKCRDAQDSLALRIAEYRPMAIVSVLLGIKGIVEAAAIASGTNARLFATPFAGNGQQSRFHSELLRILPDLPRASLQAPDAGSSRTPPTSTRVERPFAEPPCPTSSKRSPGWAERNPG
jgi:hypothetical protein